MTNTCIIFYIPSLPVEAKRLVRSHVPFNINMEGNDDAESVFSTENFTIEEFVDDNLGDISED